MFCLQHTSRMADKATDSGMTPVFTLILILHVFGCTCNINKRAESNLQIRVWCKYTVFLENSPSRCHNASHIIKTSLTRPPARCEFTGSTHTWTLHRLYTRKLAGWSLCNVQPTDSDICVLSCNVQICSGLQCDSEKRLQPNSVNAFKTKCYLQL